MACPVSKRCKLLLLSYAVFAVAATASSQKPWLRQEHVLSPTPGGVEISSRGKMHHASGMMGLAQRTVSSLVRRQRNKDSRASQRRNTTHAFHGDGVAMPEDTRPFDLRCVDYPRGLGSDSADPVSTGQLFCSGEVCLKDQYIAAGDQCCNCDAGAQFRAYDNTQCLGDSGLSESKTYDGEYLENPQPFDGEDPDKPTDVLGCMETCWSMGEDCTGISIVNSESNFAGKCFFRKGALRYIHDYHSCYNSTCEQKEDEVDDILVMTTTQAPSNDTRLVFCDDQAVFENTPCTDIASEARPRTHTIPWIAPTADEVVDKRDCFVKYLWFR